PARDHEEGEADDALADEQHAEERIETGDELEVPAVGRRVDRLREEGHPRAVERGQPRRRPSAERALRRDAIEERPEEDHEDQEPQGRAELAQDLAHIEEERAQIAAPASHGRVRASAGGAVGGRSVSAPLAEAGLALASTGAPPGATFRTSWSPARSSRDRSRSAGLTGSTCPPSHGSPRCRNSVRGRPHSPTVPN